MKVLLTTDTYLPSVNGVAISTHNLYKELKELGHDVRVLTLSSDGVERVEGDIYYLKSINSFIYPGTRIKIPFFNRPVHDIINWRPDIIHSQTEFSTMLAAKLMSVRFKIPQVHTYHTLYEDYLNYFLKGKVIRKTTAAKLTATLFNTFEAVIVPTEKVRDVLMSYGIKKDIYTIPTGIDISKFQRQITEDELNKLSAKYKINSRDKLIVYVGRIAEEKNLKEIILLFREVIRHIDGVKLLIVGGGPYLDELRKFVKRLSLDEYIHFTGMVKPQDVYKYYKLGKMFVTASLSETQGLTYIEALSSGCPVLCRYDRCIEGIVENGCNGFAYKEGKEFIEYAVRILRDEKLQSRLSACAVNRADEYSCRTFGERVSNVYSIITKNHEESLGTVIQNV
ncbi:MAG: glycosyltransferase family 4 protein [Methanobacterium paludis]|nr:glycosyltransferase family 4 protein [Methanobacterium paludis]